MPAFNNSVEAQPWLNAVNASGEPCDFLKEIYRASSIKIRAQIRRANLIVQKSLYKIRLEKIMKQYNGFLTNLARSPLPQGTK